MNTSIILTLAVLAGVTLTTQAADVKAIWDKQCLKCHGADGRGATKAGKMAEAKDMTDPKWQANLDDARAFKSIKEGIKEGDKVRMKPVEGATDEDIRGLVEYSRKFKK